MESEAGFDCAHTGNESEDWPQSAGHSHMVECTMRMGGNAILRMQFDCADMAAYDIGRRA